MKRRFSGILVAAMALVLIAGTSTKAEAAFMAYICDDAACAGGNDIVVTDQGAGDNFPGSAIVGQINAGAVNFAGFTIITNVSQSKPLIGSAGNPQLDITFQATTSDAAAHSVFLYAQDTGFTGTGTGTLTLGGTQDPIGGTTGVIGRAWAGATNTNTTDPRAVGPLFINTGTLANSPFSATASGVVPISVNPYAMTIGVQITRSVAGTSTGDLHLTVVPEPATMALFGLGLFGFGAASRRRKRQ